MQFNFPVVVYTITTLIVIIGCTYCSLRLLESRNVKPVLLALLLITADETSRWNRFSRMFREWRNIELSWSCSPRRHPSQGKKIPRLANSFCAYLKWLKLHLKWHDFEYWAFVWSTDKVFMGLCKSNWWPFCFVCSRIASLLHRLIAEFYFQQNIQSSAYLVRMSQISLCWQSCLVVMRPPWPFSFALHGLWGQHIFPLLGCLHD
jgi:hypothetical protein